MSLADEPPILEEGPGAQCAGQGRTNTMKPNVFMQRTRLTGLASAVALATMLAAAPVVAQHQAPMLDELVPSGALPPLEERLPANPLVITPVESVGTYGGTWHSALRGGLDNAWIA